jgi:hypothetical protein
VYVIGHHNIGQLPLNTGGYLGLSILRLLVLDHQQFVRTCQATRLDLRFLRNWVELKCSSDANVRLQSKQVVTEPENGISGC